MNDNRLVASGFDADISDLESSNLNYALTETGCRLKMRLHCKRQFDQIQLGKIIVGQANDFSRFVFHAQQDHAAFIIGHTGNRAHDRR